MTIGTETINDVSWMVPLKWKVMKHMYRGTTLDEQLSNFYSALLNLPPSTIDEMNVEDVQHVFDTVKPFLLRTEDSPAKT